MVSIAIVAIGALALAVILFTGSRQRERAAMRVMLGDDSTAVVGLLGEPPHRCPPSDLAHLRSEFAGGLPRPTIDEEIARLRGETAERWLYPSGEGCVPGGGATEIGIDAGRRVLWIVPARGRRPLVYTGASG
jgi:hypothetical protein